MDDSLSIESEELEEMRCDKPPMIPCYVVGDGGVEPSFLQKSIVEIYSCVLWFAFGRVIVFADRFIIRCIQLLEEILGW